MNERKAHWFTQAMDTLRNQDRALAEAAEAIYEYVTDKWSGSMPAKEQTDAVNRYYEATHCGWKEKVSARELEELVAHRRIAGQRVSIALIRFLDREQLHCADRTLEAIANDPRWHLGAGRGISR